MSAVPEWKSDERTGADLDRSIAQRGDLQLDALAGPVDLDAARGRPGRDRDLSWYPEPVRVAVDAAKGARGWDGEEGAMQGEC
jgi:hypothetical protein